MVLAIVFVETRNLCRHPRRSAFRRCGPQFADGKFSKTAILQQPGFLQAKVIGGRLSAFQVWRQLQSRDLRQQRIIRDGLWQTSDTETLARQIGVVIVAKAVCELAVVGPRLDGIFFVLFRETAAPVDRGRNLRRLRVLRELLLKSLACVLRAVLAQAQPRDFPIGVSAEPALREAFADLAIEIEGAIVIVAQQENVSCRQETLLQPGTIRAGLTQLVERLEKAIVVLVGAGDLQQVEEAFGVGLAGGGR